MIKFWVVGDKARIGRGSGIRDGSGTYGCPICWNVNRGWENNHRLKRDDPRCPICQVELYWVEENE